MNEFGVSTTLVVTLKKGLNDHEVGRVIQYAVQQPAVRGVTFQPIQAAGRLEEFDPDKENQLKEIQAEIALTSGRR